MTNESGTKFTIDRKIFNSDIWFASPWKLKIWIYLIGKANHKDGIFMGIPLKRGELIRSYRTIQKECSYKVGYRLKKPSLSTIKTICEELTKDARIERRSEQGGQVIKICNYNGLQPFKKHEAHDEANDTRTIPERNKNVKNVLKNKYSVQFDSFWSLYPKKVGKHKAYSAWKIHTKNIEVENIVSVLKLQMQSEAWRNDGGKYIPHPTTYITQRRWEDEVEKVNQRPSVRNTMDPELTKMFEEHRQQKGG